MRKIDFAMWKRQCPKTLVAMFAILAVASVSLPAHAATVVGNYQYTFSESDKFLYALDMYNNGSMDAQTLADIEMQVACDNPHNRVRARNRVALMITNDAGSGGDLTSFTLQINQPGFVFGTGDADSPDYLGEYFSVTSYSNPAVDIVDSSVMLSGTLLTINFSGLSPGESTIFRLDFDTDGSDPNAFEFPDYREVLFGLDSIGNAGVNALGETTATFTMGSMSTTSFATTLQPSLSTSYINDNLRAYETMDPVGQMGGGGTTVPEPSTTVMLLAGVSSWLGVRRRRRN